MRLYHIVFRIYSPLLMLFFFTSCSGAKKPTGLKQGDMAPLFQGVDQHGNQLSLTQLLASGPVVLFFYRGSWCPVCNKYVSQFQDSLQMVLDKGASVVAVTPETPEYVGEMIRANGLTFSILSDTANRILKAYKVDFRDKGLKKFFHKLNYGKRYSDANPANTLPIPATYIIGADGKIRWRYFRESYKERASVAEIVQNL